MAARVWISDEERASRIAAFIAQGMGSQEASIHVSYGEVPASIDATVKTEKTTAEDAEQQDAGSESLRLARMDTAENGEGKN